MTRNSSSILKRTLMKIAPVLSRILVILLIGGGLASFSIGQETPLKDRRLSISMQNQPVGIVFRYLIGNYDIPIGFEESSLDTEHGDYNFETNHPFAAVEKRYSADGKSSVTLRGITTFEPAERRLTLNFDEAKLGVVLNAIVEQMKYYQWEINDGVVNISPKEGRDELFKTLLSTNIETFAVGRDQSVRDITTGIIALPEIKKFLTDHHLYFDGKRGGSKRDTKAQYDRPLPLEISFSNLTFRELLNRATLIKRGGWIVRRKRFPGNGDHIDIDI